MKDRTTWSPNSPLKHQCSLLVALAEIQRNLALRELANSLHGFVGSETDQLPDPRANCAGGLLAVVDPTLGGPKVLASPAAITGCKVIELRISKRGLRLINRILSVKPFDHIGSLGILPFTALVRSGKCERRKNPCAGQKGVADTRTDKELAGICHRLNLADGRTGVKSPVSRLLWSCYRHIRPC